MAIRSNDVDRRQTVLQDSAHTVRHEDPAQCPRGKSSIYNQHTSEILLRHMNIKTYTGTEVRELRRKIGLNQHEFWQRFQTTQSGGSRYESGREIPPPIQLLLNIAFGTEAKATACVGALRALARRPGKAKQSTKKSTGFGVLP